MRIIHPSGHIIEIPDSPDAAMGSPVTVPSMPMTAMMPMEKEPAKEPTAEKPKEEPGQSEPLAAQTESVDVIHGGIMDISDPFKGKPGYFQYEPPKE